MYNRTYRYCLNFLSLIVIATFAFVSVRAQEVEETIRIKTRVVFLDALVKDKKTNLPISNLAQENFQVLDNGKPRAISYFTREGQARKPLALVLVIDLREDGAGRFMKEAPIVKAMESELAKLPPEDEVAILATNIGEDEGRVWLSEFTNDRGKIAAAFARVQEISQRPEGWVQNPQPQQPAESSVNQAHAKEVVSTETIQGRNGAVLTRTTM